MNWPPHLLRAFAARLRTLESTASSKRSPRLKPVAPRHTGPGFGTLVIGVPPEGPGTR
jgi:hypothetical protein